jgi:hypothetical protein
MDTMASFVLHSVTGVDHIGEQEEGKNQRKEERIEIEQEIKRHKKEGMN